MSGAVEQLAHQIGLKNYEEYTLFEARKVCQNFSSSMSIIPLKIEPSSPEIPLKRKLFLILKVQAISLAHTSLSEFQY